VLSAGQRRRVALARLLIVPASLWVLDEPITNLDVAGIALVESLLSRHLGQGGMIVAAAHQALLTGHAGVRSVQLQ
jgi:heme exporter protein A